MIKHSLKGSDLRTVSFIDGTRVRLLTYRIPGQTGLDLIQLGKPIGDQLRILNQFLSGLLIIGGAVIILLGFVSWWQAGRMLAFCAEIMGQPADVHCQCQP